MSSYVQWILLAVSFGQLFATRRSVNLEDHLQPDEVDRNTYLHPPENSNICARECKTGEQPKLCYYKWKVENYVTLGGACGDCPNNITACYHEQCITADGYERGILTVNRRLPGPSIEVCRGDRVIVDVENAMQGRTTTIHWHGVFQEHSQYMDGVPMVTQCSIYEGLTFRYDFHVNNEGTLYWHSHDGLQKLDGLQGNLVVRIPKSEDPNGKLYDLDLPEHKIFISDWTTTDADQLFPGTLRRRPNQDADSFFINGRGRHLAGNESTAFPYSEIKVQKGTKYRFRIIGGVCTVCATEFTIQGHTMLVIATDGNPVKPTRVDSIIIYSGERYDVVIEANQTPGSYWMHMRGTATCEPIRIYGLGVLQYENVDSSLSGDPGYDGPIIENKRVLNPINGSCTAENGGVCPTQLLNSNHVPSYILKKLPDYTFPVTFGFRAFNKTTFFEGNNYQRFFVRVELGTGTTPNNRETAIGEWGLLTSIVNNISYISAPAPLLTQPKDIPSDVFCPKNSEGFPACPNDQPFCTCVHLLEVRKGSVVQILLADTTPRPDLNHPFHLHGYAFYVMATGQFESNETYRDVFRRLKTTTFTQSPAPALKDSVSVPSNGYTIIKFRADNPGYWFFHCHFIDHLASGMAAVFKVGEQHDMPRPPDNFPKCKEFKNTVYY